MLIIIQRVASKNATLFYDARFKFGDLSDNLAQNLQGIQTVKAFGREAEQLTLFNEKNVGFYEASMKTAAVRSFVLPGMVFLISISLVLLVFIGVLSLMWILDSTRIIAFTFIPLIYVILIMVAIFVAVRIGLRRISQSKPNDAQTS